MQYDDCIKCGLLMNVSAPLAKMLLVLLASMTSATAINGAIQRKMRGIEKIMASG